MEILQPKRLVNGLYPTHEAFDVAVPIHLLKFLTPLVKDFDFISAP